MKTFARAVRASGVALTTDCSATADEANENSQSYDSKKKDDRKTHFGKEFFWNGLLWRLDLGTDEEDLFGIS